MIYILGYYNVIGLQDVSTPAHNIRHDGSDTVSLVVSECHLYRPDRAANAGHTLHSSRLMQAVWLVCGME